MQLIVRCFRHVGEVLNYSVNSRSPQIFAHFLRTSFQSIRIHVKFTCVPPTLKEKHTLGSSINLGCNTLCVRIKSVNPRHLLPQSGHKRAGTPCQLVSNRMMQQSISKTASPLSGEKEENDTLRAFWIFSSEKADAMSQRSHTHMSEGKILQEICESLRCATNWHRIESQNCLEARFENRSHSIDDFFSSAIVQEWSNAASYLRKCIAEESAVVCHYPNNGMS